MLPPVPPLLRPFTKRPSFAIAAICIVAIGVALATTAASIVDALVFRPIPTREIDNLYRIHGGLFRGQVTPADVRDIFEGIDVPAFSYFHSFSMEFKMEKRHDLVTVSQIQGDHFKTLGWNVAQGRVFQETDHMRGSEPVTIISHDFWQNTLGADPQAIGKSAELNAVLFRIIGIMPPEFDRVHRTIRPEFWIPFAHTFDDWLYDHRNSHSQIPIVRIDTPQEVPAVQTRLDQISEYLRNAYPKAALSMRLTLHPERHAARTFQSETTQQGYIIIGLVSAMLLLTCFNLGNMLLSNAYRREREFAIRRSLGARPTQIALQLVQEALLLASIGGILGTLFSYWLVGLANGLPFAQYVDIVFDRNTAFAAMGATVLTGLISGLAPAYHLARGNTQSSLAMGAKGSRVAPSTKLLLIAQIAFSGALLTSGIMYTLSLKSSLEYSTGYDPEQIAYFETHLRSVNPNKRDAAVAELREQIESLPGVSAAAFSSNYPLQGFGQTSVKTDQFDPQVEDDKCLSNYSFIGPGFFKTLGVPFLKGNDFTDADIGWPYKASIVNRAFEQRYFPESGALGREYWPFGDTGENRVRIIGVVKDFSNEPFVDPIPQVYLAQAQPRVFMLIRAAGNPRSILDSLEVVTRDPSNGFIAEEIQFYEDAQNRAFRNERSALIVLGTLGIVALILSSAGVWYTTRQYVRQSRKELSIRLAIGARPRELISFIVRRSMRLISIGLAFGTVLSIVIARWIQSSLNGVSAGQPLPYILMILTLIGVAWLASYLPARSASRADPKEALSEV